MATEEYKSNSHKSKEQSQVPVEKKVELSLIHISEPTRH